MKPHQSKNKLLESSLAILIIMKQQTLLVNLKSKKCKAFFFRRRDPTQEIFQNSVRKSFSKISI